ncbi:MAG: SUMF1/EgtB/PvdO family nonheme iron enzyme [Kiritimatiellae bacterium]|nr:SUMF1/EgtB/PvdO family nonheme iron enzyme [Kiritimatiellia bacterium]
MTYDTISDGMTIQPGAAGTLLAGRYRIVRQLGQGGMGSVWLAEDTQLDGKLFAIKMLPSILVSNKRAYRQLKDEALVAMQLIHPNIVQIRAFEENNGNPFLVMDYIDGVTLDDYLADCCGDVLTQRRRDAEGGDGRAASTRPPSGGLSEGEVIRLLKPIAAALDYAHGEGVVHRDVKPANVMIRKDGHPFILDFGIAREIEETMTRVTGKLSSGTLLYMSPEQLRGLPPKKEQDIYSFAAMVYECLMGEPPFSRGQVEYQILNEQPEPLDPHFAKSGSVMQGLAKKPEDRPSTCAAVVEEQRDESPRERAGDPGRVDSCLEATTGKKRAGSGALPEYTQADCIRLMADAKVAQRHAARFSGDPACKMEIQEIEDDFVRADAIFAEKQWALAAECYARIVERGKKLEEGVARRTAEENARRETEARARRDAEARKWQEAAERARLAALPKTGDVKPLTLPGGAKMEMIYVGPGSFVMGSPQSEEVRDDDEAQHRVTLTKGFWLGKYEVTQEQWQSVMGDNPSHFKGDRNPVECVSWEDCQRFIEKVNARLNCGARLPTEAEWEYACRAGTATAYFWGNALNGDKANCDDTFPCGTTLKKRWRQRTTQVGSYEANPWGFYDMHGNVWEWCNDWHGSYGGNATDPQGPASGGGRVLRGGGWFNNARNCRSACRNWFQPGGRDSNCGFRLCCDRMPPQ